MPQYIGMRRLTELAALGETRGDTGVYFDYGNGLVEGRIALVIPRRPVFYPQNESLGEPVILTPSTTIYLEARSADPTRLSLRKYRISLV